MSTIFHKVCDHFYVNSFFCLHGNYRYAKGNYVNLEGSHFYTVDKHFYATGKLLTGRQFPLPLKSYPKAKSSYNYIHVVTPVPMVNTAILYRKSVYFQFKSKHQKPIKLN